MILEHVGVDYLHHMAEVTNRCPLCSNFHTVTVSYFRLRTMLEKNMNTQDAFPDLSVVQREQLISGLCPECQKIIFEEDMEWPSET